MTTTMQTGENKQATPKQGLTITQALQSTYEGTVKKVNDYKEKGQLTLPPNYQVGNALNAMQLMIQNDEKLQQCTMNSIAKAMLEMAILGLTPNKTQCYLIPYGNQAKLSVSYFGKEAIAKRIDPTIEKIIAKEVRQGDLFDFQNNADGSYKIINHQQTLESMDSPQIIAGYATIYYTDGKEPSSLVMTYERIKKSWSMSSAKPIDEKGEVKPNSAHGKFPSEMIGRTLINAITKSIINSSNDSDLVLNTMKSVELEMTQAETEQEKNNAIDNPTVIDVDFTAEEIEQQQNNPIVINPDTGEIIND